MSTPQPNSADSSAEQHLYDVFLSHHSSDKTQVEAIAARLEDDESLKPFLDKWHLVPGEPWQEALEEALDQSGTCAVFLGASGLGPWENEEMRVALDERVRNKSFRVIPVLLPGAEPKDKKTLPRFLRRLTWVDFRVGIDDPEAFRHLVAGIRGLAPGRQLVSTSSTGKRPQLSEILQSMFDVVCDPAGEIAISDDQAQNIKAHNPVNLIEFRLCRIAEWSLPRYYLDKRFVNLTLLLDKEGESRQQRWQRAENFRFNDLRDVLQKTPHDPALVLLGAPGSGKSTLLRRFQFDHSVDRLRDGQDWITFFIQLNEYDGEQKPREWLIASWVERYPEFYASASLDSYLQKGRALLLLDALNEMQPRNGRTYLELIGWWKEFTQKAARAGNRILFSCRSLDYSATLSSKELRVPQIEVQPMSRQQVREFLAAYTPSHQERLWNDLDGSPQFDLYKTPYFLKLLCDQVEAAGDLPKGRAGLFTSFMRKALLREIDGELLQPGALLTYQDYKKLARDEWRNTFDLPEKGLLIPKLSELAHAMQENGMKSESAQVRIERDDIGALIGAERVEEILKAGLSLNVLDEIAARDEIAFFHQLLQEYFAARRLAKEPKPELIHTEWVADKVRPALDETLAGLVDGDLLPNLQQTGWEETTLTAAPMAKDPQEFTRNLMPHNLPLAARCAASPEMKISDKFKREIQDALIARTQEMKADLRARIAAGEALGTLGDPRFVRRTGPHGEYLLPPLVETPRGKYPMGLDEAPYDNEKPAHTVELAPFQIGQFPVTNMEYQCFIEAGGYEDEQWWDTEESRAWMRGEACTEGIKEQWRDNLITIRGWSEEYIRGMVKQNRTTSEQAEEWLTWRNWTDERFEQELDTWFPAGKLYRQPEFWDDIHFNNLSQPVVGVTWFEARAYCTWLTANAAMKDCLYRLPTEVEFEAAARGKAGRLFPYGNTFDVSRSNTFESHIRRTTPVGIFDNATPEGAVDLSGNAYTWTLTIYDLERFPYPYKKDDGREDIHQTDVRRVLRGGSWVFDHDYARAVYRNYRHPASRRKAFGFRVVVSNIAVYVELELDSADRANT